MVGPLRLGIQADDLTGACDTGAPFAARGLDTLVLLPGQPVPMPPPTVLVLDTESRALPPPAARDRAREAVRCLRAEGATMLYKKVDSTLRGALAAELGGAREGAGSPPVLLAPAFPAQGRTVRDGHLYLDGRPAEDTPLVRDSRFPPTGGNVLALLGREGPHPAGLIPLATVRRGPGAVGARFGHGLAALVADAETDGDLTVLAAAGLAAEALLAGSAGLATALAGHLGGLAAAAPRHDSGRPRLARPLLVVAGSPHPTTRAQVARLTDHGVPAVRIEADADPPRPPFGSAMVLVLPEAPDRPDDTTREEAARRLGIAVRRLLERQAVGGLVLVGGDTAAAVCRALGASGLALHGELGPGLAWGRLLGGPHDGLPVVTKAGGFGNPDTLVRVLEAAT